jgi:hypothetical protein
MKNYNLTGEYPNPTTVWNLYRLLPDYVNFKIEIISRYENCVKDSLNFVKDNGRNVGEKEMYVLLGKYTKCGYRSINFDWQWGLGSDAVIQIVVD